MRVFVVSNPHATSTTSSQRQVLLRALSADVKLEWEETTNRGHAAALACRAMREGVDAVIALGGDGTVNEVVNGLLTDGVHESVPTLGIVPGGSTNVFARALGLPNDAVEATSILLDSIATGRRRWVSLGRAEDRWFTFTAGMGLDAAVVAAVEKHRDRGAKSTPALYVRNLARAYRAFDRRRPHLELAFPDGTSVACYTAVVTNCLPWTYLGARPITPTPQASLDSGLEIYVRTRLGLVSMLVGGSRILRQTSRDREFGALQFHDQTGFVLRAKVPVPLQVDGDFLQEHTEVRFAGVTHALQVYH